MTLSGGVCRVCGTALAPPLVGCPRCETPHHRDCWDYNGGCSTYGCLEHLPAVVADTLPASEPVSSAELYVDLDPRSNPLIAAVILIGAIHLTPAALFPYVFGGLALLAYGYAARGTTPDVREAAKRLEGDPEAVTLESKALAALVGASVPHQLAQAYALFEQRHPRRALATEQQTALAFEMADAGYTVLALEAFDKALKLRDADVSKLTARRDELVDAEPAYALLEEGSKPGEAMRRKLVDEVAGDVLALLTLSPGGWAWQAREQLVRALGSANILEDDAYTAGPFAAEDARAMAGALWDAGHPTALVPASALALGTRAQDLTAAQLSQASARLATALGERVIAWRDVRAIVYGLVVTGDESDFRPAVEVHVGDEPWRLRVYNPDPALFRYLGRRMQYTAEENLKLFVKDLVRFAPGARCSHGVLGLMMERRMPGSRFQGLEHLDAYARWFFALRHARMR